MNTVKIIHTADLHLDCKFAGLPADKSKIRRQELKDSFADAGNVIPRSKAEMLDNFVQHQFGGNLYGSSQLGINACSNLFSMEKLESFVFLAMLIPPSSMLSVREQHFSASLRLLQVVR